MLFNSVEFALFLPVVFLLYWLVFRGVRSQNLFVVAASYFFYGFWDWRFLGLIFVTTLTSFLGGLLIERGRRRLALWGNIAVNLGILCAFKYFDFFAHSFASVLRMAGMDADDVTLGLILPVGISFYTFQALSYVIDVYRGKMAPTHDAPAYFAFISFFPQLVAGPIERATNLLPQFARPRNFSYAQGVEGCRLILIGLFKKMVVADNCARVVVLIFDDYAHMGGLNLLLGAFLFSMQIYGDFSGYSDIAIGTARLFGIRLMWNFRSPYFARSPGEFWQRWHISLTSWFRDYIYIPLGGSRRGKARTAANTAVVFMLSGLWHGANYTFIAWGAWHAALMMPRIARGRKAMRGEPMLREVPLMGLTFLLVMLGWILFRADTVTQAVHYIGRMFTHITELTPALDRYAVTAVMWSCIMLAVEWVTRRRVQAFDFPVTGITGRRWVRLSIYVVTALVILSCHGYQETFIYFRF